jgi:hypothetical protein
MLLNSGSAGLHVPRSIGVFLYKIFGETYE